jgi:hypothetical protein
MDKTDVVRTKRETISRMEGMLGSSLGCAIGLPLAMGGSILGMAPTVTRVCHEMRVGRQDHYAGTPTAFSVGNVLGLGILAYGLCEQFFTGDSKVLGCLQEFSKGYLFAANALSLAYEAGRFFKR